MNNSITNLQALNFVILCVTYCSTLVPEKKTPRVSLREGVILITFNYMHI